MLSFFLCENLSAISQIINDFFYNVIHKYFKCNTYEIHTKSISFDLQDVRHITHAVWLNVAVRQ